MLLGDNDVAVIGSHCESGEVKQIVESTVGPAEQAASTPHAPRTDSAPTRATASVTWWSSGYHVLAATGVLSSLSELVSIFDECVLSHRHGERRP
jgi:hypothetical protein